MIKLLKEKIKNNNGFTGQDIIIAIFIILLFLSLITTLIINLSSTSSEISKVKILTETLTKVADKIDSLNYDEIDVTSQEKAITELAIFYDLKLNNNMKITYTVEEDETKTKKTIKLVAKYPNVETVDITIGKRIVSTSEGTGSESSGDDSSTTQNIQINTNAQYPFNRPNHTLEDASLTSYIYGEGKKIVPIKFVWSDVTQYSKKGAWVKTTEDDLEWYSLEENIWPIFSYETVSQPNKSITGYSNDKEYTKEKVLKYNPFINTRGSKQDDKYAFIWLPRVLRENGTTNQGTYASSFFGYEKTNNKIIYSENNGYLADTTETLNQYNNSLYNVNNSYIKYQRGTLIGYTTTKNMLWDAILNQSVPIELKNKITAINMHTNEYI